MGNSIGNTINKSSSDYRFGDSLLANEVKKIIMDQDSVYRKNKIKIHLAKACCADVIRPGIDGEINNVTSIAFPVAGNLTGDRCKTDGVCLSTQYVGFQLNDERAKYCGTATKAGLAGDSFSTTRGGESGSMCDNFMMDYCAKSLYEQGCIKMGPNAKGSIVPKFSTKKDNKMCWTEQNKMNYGPPECWCLNSIFGPNLNTWPGSYEPNVYGLAGENLAEGNFFSTYSLDIFNADKTTQYPVSLDKRCATAASITGAGRAKAWTLITDQGKSMTICMNQINIANSQIENASLSDINQNNNCGGPPAPAPSKTNVEVDPKIAEEAAKKAAAEKAAAETKAAEKAAAEKAAAEKSDKLEAEKKAAEKAAAESKAKLETEKKAKEDAEKAAAAKANPGAVPGAAAPAQVKADVDVKIKLEADAKLRAAIAEKLKADADAKAKADADAAKALLIAQESNTRMLMFGGGILLLIIIIGVAWFVYKSKPSAPVL
jgi:hypothetical protein